MADDEKDVAPHGREVDGTPKAPFGYTAEGNPRKGNRGRRPSGVAAPQKKAEKNQRSGSRPKSRSREETKGQLLELVGMLTTPLAAAGHSPAVRKKIGDRHADALAGDAVIVEATAPELVEGVMMYADRKPGLLAWMDKAEDAAPALIIAKAALTMVKAIAQNHANPDPDLARAGAMMAHVKAAKYAQAIQAEAESLGIVLDLPEQRAA